MQNITQNLIISLSFLFPATGFAQDVNVSFNMPTGQHLTYADCWSFTLNNISAEKQVVDLELLVTEDEQGTVVLARISDLMLFPGMKVMSITVPEARQARLVSVGPAYKEMLENDLPFYKGRYGICIRILDDQQQETGHTEHCTYFEMDQIQPGYLLFPSSGDTLCDELIHFSWTSTRIQEKEVHYSFLLTEIQNEQDAEVALRHNPILYRVDQLTTPFISLTPSRVPLTKGARYVWRIESFTGDEKLGASEANEFVMCGERSFDIQYPYYRVTKNEARSPVYRAYNGNLRLAFEYRVALSELSYSIYDANDTLVYSGVCNANREVAMDDQRLELDLKNKLNGPGLYLLKFENGLGPEYILRFYLNREDYVKTLENE